MKITKYVHSCLLVEDEGKVAVFDPGVMSKDAFDFNSLSQLDYIFITHIHQDHLDLDFVKELLSKFPDTKIISTNEVVKYLAEKSIKAQTDQIEGVTFFNSPHETVAPLYPLPEEIGIHYHNKLSDPGDSHSFKETKAVLALPITGPWGSSIKALNLALELKPKYVIPIHDWHWSDAAKQQMYAQYKKYLGEQGITFYEPETGKAIEIDI